MKNKELLKRLLYLSLFIFLLVNPKIVKATEVMEYQESYEYLKKRNAIRDYSTGEFQPQNDLKREEAAFFLALGLGLTNKEVAYFSDVLPTSYYHDFILAVKEHGIMTGTETNFNPKATITRYQAAAILNRAFPSHSESVSINSCFNDLKKEHWAYESVCKMNELGVINGIDGMFNGDKKVTRGQFVMMYARIFKMSEHYSLENIDPLILDNSYYQDNQKLVKINKGDRLEEEDILYLDLLDKQLKKQLNLYGSSLVELMEDNPVSFIVTRSKWIGNNAGMYHHKNVTNIYKYLQIGHLAENTNLILVSVPESGLIVKNFEKTFIHEFGHYLGFVILHKDYNFGEFANYRNLDQINRNEESFIVGWGETEVEMFADSYVEIFDSQFINRTNTGNFNNRIEIENFKNWAINKINNAYTN